MARTKPSTSNVAEAAPAKAAVEHDMPAKVTHYDEFNFEVPETAFLAMGLSARAAEAVVNAECSTDANPMLNPSSFVTTFIEAEARDLVARQAKVREKGWVLSAYSIPRDAQELNSLRIVVHPELNRNTVKILADDIERACLYLAEHGGNATPPKLHAGDKTSSTKC